MLKPKWQGDEMEMSKGRPTEETCMVVKIFLVLSHKTNSGDFLI